MDETTAQVQLNVFDDVLPLLSDRGRLEWDLAFERARGQKLAQRVAELEGTVRLLEEAVPR